MRQYLIVSGLAACYQLLTMHSIEGGDVAIVRLMPLAQKISRHLMRDYYIDYQDEEDLRQAVYAGLVEAVRNDDGRGAVDGLATKRMYGSGRDYIYKMRRHFGRGISADITHATFDFDIADHRNPERDLECKQILGMLDTDKRAAAAMRMIYADGLSYIETAEKIGMSEGGLYKMLTRAKRAHK